MTHNDISQLSDRDLVNATTHVADQERRATAELIALLAELDARRLYLGDGCSSLFAYCTQVLHLSEAAAYSRITAARAARRFPIIFTLLADGTVTLTSITLLAPHLTDDTHESLLAAAHHKSRRDIERLIACLHPQPDVASTVRKLPARSLAESDRTQPADTAPTPMDEGVATNAPLPGASSPAVTLNRQPAPGRPLVAPISPESYLMRITISGETHARLERARDLLRHVIPSGDPAAIMDRALSVLLEQLERTRLAATSRPRRAGHSIQAPETSRTRHVPAAVKRIVWARDQGRCAFVGPRGRCTETGFLKFHHVVPFAAGGATEPDNLQLRCRGHNAYEADCYFREGRDLSSEASV